MVKAERADALADRLSTEQLDQIGYDTPAEYADDLKLAAALAGVGYEPCVKNDAAIFASDGSIAFDYSDDCSGAGIYAVPLLEVDRDYDWSLSGDVLTITEVDANTTVSRNYLITTLTNTELVLRETEAGLYDFLFEGEDIGAVDLSDLFLDYYFLAR